MYLTNVPVGTVVFNATGVENGVPYVQYNLPLAGGASVDLVVEYKVPVQGGSPVPGSIPTAVTFRAVPVLPLPPLNPVGTLVGNVTVDRPGDGRYVVNIPTLVGRTYYVQYSADNATWQTARPLLTGTGNTISWISNGPPKTDTDSNGVAHPLLPRPADQLGRPAAAPAPGRAQTRP
ncbi:MAG: hypothetical protein HC814_04960, partial [Rhodobacteraceae bacterium]|nr:hypothetical protein [Paracoccaceae bacterium]